MTELANLIWVERYRPRTFDELILQDKSLLEKYLKSPATLPSFIFYSTKPGTGKTSTAKIIITALDCDALVLNSSQERGIDTIRDKITLFASGLSSNPSSKRCIFLDEADGLTRQAQDSLRNLMEEYSDNCFFIFTANDLNKIIEPIRSRCQSINFDQPPKSDIADRLHQIMTQEAITATPDDRDTLIVALYPDIRSMVMLLQTHKVEGISITDLLDKKNVEYQKMWEIIQQKNITEIYNIVYSGTFDLCGFNSWLFHRIFSEYEKFTAEQISKIVFCLAENEKWWNMQANREVIFLNNILQIVEVL